MSNPPKIPNTTSNSSSLGVFVPPEVWVQMQQLLATFGPSNPINPSSAPIIPQLAPSVDLPAEDKSLSAPSPTFPPSTKDTCAPSTQLTSPSTQRSDEDKAIAATCLSPSLPLDNPQPLGKDNCTNKQHVNQLTNTATVDGVTTSIDIYNYKTFQ
ncbi:hypothetical protein PCANC_01753 [Puccinia coronata f. sp. avenae]|uniref:Uncharacterized protein n=1 Tax=Puccinia coronata f. sp. avenae TaxID=200324 RepID=A0A2N5W593_9BASI|nr:hypothetical protein PCANC_01753 [Puccinia coronata f. sp. avenae]